MGAHRSPRSNMAAGYLLLALSCGMMTSLSNAQWTEDRNRHPSARPPPVTSFLETLKSLRTPRSEGEPWQVAAALHPQGSPLLYVQPEDAGDVFRPHRRPVPRRREKRHVSPSVAMRGCHLGTCQTQNLASMLYRLGYNNGKDGSSKDTRDPLGYGRRRRSLSPQTAPRHTQSLASMLYRLGYDNSKDNSNTNTRDPQGYGRRRRSLPPQTAPRRTAWAQRMLAT